MHWIPTVQLRNSKTRVKQSSLTMQQCSNDPAMIIAKQTASKKGDIFIYTFV